MVFRSAVRAIVVLLACPVAALAEAPGPVGMEVAPPAAVVAPAAVEAGEVTLLGAAIVERPARADSLRLHGPDATARRRLSLSPHGFDRCDYFLVLEVSGARAPIETSDALDSYLLSHALVVMRNLDPRWAVGGGMQFHWATGNVKGAPEVRVRRWFRREQSVEAAFGWQLGAAPAMYGGDFLQQVGPIASIRYSPHPRVFAQAGVARYREFQRTQDPTLFLTSGTARESTRPFFGVGFAGRGALLALGVEAVVFIVIGAALSGLS